MAAVPQDQDQDITRAIQNEYQDFFKRFRDRTTGFRESLLTPGTPQYTSMNPLDTNFVCTRDSFYLSLLQINDAYYRDLSIQRLRKCAQKGEEELAAQGQRQFLAQLNPLDGAIYAYSTLMRDLYDNDKREIVSVINFLQRDDYGTDRYKEKKSEILLLLGDDNNALKVSPIVLRRETYFLAEYLFRNEKRYIDSSPVAKSVISEFVIVRRDRRMIELYDQLTPFAKAHFFVHILENNIPTRPEMTEEIKYQLMLPESESELNKLLEYNKRYDYYPNAYQAAQRIREDLINQTLRRVQTSIKEQSFKGSGGKTSKKSKSKRKSRRHTRKSRRHTRKSKNMG